MTKQAQVQSHAYDAPGIGPREFLEAVMCDRSLPTDVRIDAATRLQQYDLLSGRHPEFPEDKTPIDYVAPPKTKRKRRKSKPAAPVITRYDWQCLAKYHEYVRETGAPVRDDMRKLRDRIVIRNPVIYKLI